MQRERHPGFFRVKILICRTGKMDGVVGGDGGVEGWREGRGGGVGVGYR